MNESTIIPLAIAVVLLIIGQLVSFYFLIDLTLTD